MSIHENLRQLRLGCGMTQEQVAEKIGITRQALSSYESGRTRPDVDMLMRLGEIYGADLNGILYGQTRRLQAVRRIKTAALIFGVLLVLLTVISSTFLWSSNHFFALSEGPMSAEELVLFASRHRLMLAWTWTDRIILTISLWGGILLLGLLISGNGAVSLKAKVLYTAALSAAMLAVAVLAGAADPLYAVENYTLVPCTVIGRLGAFLAVDILIEFFQARNRKG